MHVSDDLFLGPVSVPALSDPANPSPMSRGVGPLGRVFAFDVVPVAAAAANVAALQANASARNLTLGAGAGVTASVDLTGATRYNLDVARCLTVVSNNIGDTTQTVTVTGFDFYGLPMTSRVTLNGTTAVLTPKAFKAVTAIAVSAATAGSTTVGTSDRLGLPYRVTDAGYVSHVKWAGVLAADTGTFVPAVVTSPSTVLLGDVRGLYTPSTASDGVKRLVMLLVLPALASGPQATRVGAVGVDQV